MLNYFIITFIVLSVCTLGMALGVILSNKPLKGSCGGLGRVMGNKCAFCEKKDRCQKEAQS